MCLRELKIWNTRILSIKICQQKSLIQSALSISLLKQIWMRYFCIHVRQIYPILKKIKCIPSTGVSKDTSIGGMKIVKINTTAIDWVTFWWKGIFNKNFKMTLRWGLYVCDRMDEYIRSRRIHTKWHRAGGFLKLI